ncbi:NmrA family NAD(P)-binding protein [Nocardia sp. NPDC049526]|uniref:NmrA family NAD(P)-binding protein n=1 Tax=Nocardia sp. NPDC049526 TaxID=3364316 RepID=UPI0037A426C6
MPDVDTAEPELRQRIPSGLTGGKGPVLVIGATGQQGRATTAQLLERGWEVHAFVHDLKSPAAHALRESGADLIEGIWTTARRCGPMDGSFDTAGGL